VTSIAENGQFWVSYLDRHGNKARTQEYGSHLFPCGPANDPVVVRIEAKAQEIRKLSEEKEAIATEFRAVTPKDWEAK
jgi:hypothetical protein